MTKEQMYRENQYFNSNCESVRDCYARPSERKVAIEQHIKEEMYQRTGWGYRVLSHNCNFFTCAYQYISDDGNWMLCVHTPSRRLDFQFAD